MVRRGVVSGRADVEWWAGGMATRKKERKNLMKNILEGILEKLPVRRGRE